MLISPGPHVCTFTHVQRFTSMTKYSYSMSHPSIHLECLCLPGIAMDWLALGAQMFSRGSLTLPQLGGGPFVFTDHGHVLNSMKSFHWHTQCQVCQPFLPWYFPAILTLITCLMHLKPLVWVLMKHHIELESSHHSYSRLRSTPLPVWGKRQKKRGNREQVILSKLKRWALKELLKTLCAQLLYCDHLSVQMMASRDTIDLCGGPAATPTPHHPSLHLSQHGDHDRAQMMGKEEDEQSEWISSRTGAEAIYAGLNPGPVLQQARWKRYPSPCLFAALESQLIDTSLGIIPQAA